MAKINKIINKDDYIILYFDNDKLFISYDNYYKYTINKDNEIDEELIDILKQEELVLKTYLSCLRKLAIKDYSIANMMSFLIKSGLNNDDIKEIINKLKSYHLLADDKYCLNKISQYNNDLLSYKQIIYKLKKDGIVEDIINKNIKYDYDLEYKKVEKLVNRYNSKNSNKSQNAKRQNIIASLVSKGYSYEIVKDIVDSIEISQENELDLLNKEYNRIRKRYEKKYQDYELYSKIYTALLSKGFKSKDIKILMEEK